MLWVVVFLAIAVAGLAMLVGYTVWLAHKTADVLSELGVLADQAAQLADLLGEVRMPAATTFGGARDQGAAGPVDVG